MIYTVIVTPAAETDIALAFAYIAERSPLNAQRWVRGMYKVLHNLEHFPGRCGRARESERLGVDLRHTFYKSHRIVFRIEQERRIVRVIRVPHGAQAGISSKDLPKT